MSTPVSHPLLLESKNKESEGFFRHRASSRAWARSRTTPAAPCKWKSRRRRQSVTTNPSSRYSPGHQRSIIVCFLTLIVGMLPILSLPFNVSHCSRAQSDLDATARINRDTKAGPESALAGWPQKRSHDRALVRFLLFFPTR
jgi:nitrate reductase NapE component